MRSSDLCLCYRLLHLGQLLVELDLELALKLLDLADNAVLGEVSSMKLCDREALRSCPESLLSPGRS